MAPYGVAIIVDPSFKGNLNDLVPMMAIWICDTPDNKQKWKVLCNSGIEFDPNSAIFKFDTSESRAQIVLRKLGTVDLHHGEYSHPTGWQFMQVIGSGLTPELEAAFRALGCETFEIKEDGFVARRSRT